MGLDISTGDNGVLIKVDSITLGGDIALELKEKFIELIDKGEDAISLDLSKPEYIDSSGVGKLLFMNKKLFQIEGTFKVVAISSTLYDFLDSLAITNVITIEK